MSVYKNVKMSSNTNESDTRADEEGQDAGCAVTATATAVTEDTATATATVSRDAEVRQTNIRFFVNVIVMVLDSVASSPHF
jgi:hypothetical protein